MTRQEIQDIRKMQYGGDPGGCMWVLALWMAVALAGLLLTGCRTQYVPVETVRTLIVAKTDTFIQRDSIFCHDSVVVRQQGDTLFMERWRTRWRDRWRERIVTDTFLQRDSVAVPYPVPARLSAWQQLKVDYGGWAFLSLAIAIIIYIRYRLRR